MDKRFEKVIEKLENQSSNAIEINEKLEKVFQKVKNTQKDIDDGNVVYNPATNYNGSASFVFEVVDTEGNKLENQTFNANIN